MLLLAAVLIIQQGGWRPSTDNISNFPSGLPRSGRPAALARLDPILPILKAALTTDGVELQAHRSFDGSPWIAGLPWPRDMMVLGYEWDYRNGGWEGEAATRINVFANDLDPMLQLAIDDEPPTYVVRNQRNVFMLSRGDTVPWKPVSQREFVRRMRAVLTRRARHDRTAQAALTALEADAGSATDGPMLLPPQYSEGYWPGFRRGTRAVVDFDPNYFAGRPQNAIAVIVVLGSTSRGVNTPAGRRLRTFFSRLDRAALRRLLE
jgi:hypothetical protein